MMMIMPDAMNVSINAPTHGSDRLGLAFGGGRFGCRFDLLFGIGLDSTQDMRDILTDSQK